MDISPNVKIPVIAIGYYGSRLGYIFINSA